MFVLNDLPYAYDALEPYIDEATMKLHHDKHHATYIDNLNKALEAHDELSSKDLSGLLTSLNKVPEDIRSKVRNNGGGHANHELFWGIMTSQDSGGGKFPESGDLFESVKAVFTNIENFQTKFKEAGLSRFGSGWVWLISRDGKLEIVDTPNQDTPLMEGISPLMGLDVWEHAYYLKYQNRRADYIGAWWNVVNWTKIEERLKKG